MNKLEQAKQLLEEADAVVIGAGAGFSAAAGLSYSGTRFVTYFKEYMERYGMEDMYSAGFYPFSSLEEKWGYWAKHIYHNRYQPGALPLYKDLLKLVKNKEYFVITTNVDGQFQEAGFDEKRFFEVQGNYGEWQCSVPCQPVLYDNQEAVMNMLKQTKDLKIPTALIPTCPNCGAPLTMHLRIDNTFVENQVWKDQQARYLDFLENAADKKVVFLELGVGYNTPVIIRFPFERMTEAFPHAYLLRLNREDSQGFEENTDKTLTFTQDMKEVLRAWQVHSNS